MPPDAPTDDPAPPDPRARILALRAEVRALGKTLLASMPIDTASQRDARAGVGRSLGDALRCLWVAGCYADLLELEEEDTDV